MGSRSFQIYSKQHSLHKKITKIVRTTFITMGSAVAPPRMWRLHLTLAVAVWLNTRWLEVQAFCPRLPATRTSLRAASTVTTKPFLAVPQPRRAAFLTQLMAGGNEAFSEQTYTEAVWGAISALPKVSEYYQMPPSASIEAPYLLDILLNPSKHQAGDSADAAKRVVEKTLNKAGVDVKQIRSDLEGYLAQQPKSSSPSVSSSQQRATIGPSLARVLDVARTQMKSLLNDSFVSTEAVLLALCRDDDKFLVSALQKQSKNYSQILQAVQALREKSGPANTRGAEVSVDEENSWRNHYSYVLTQFLFLRTITMPCSNTALTLPNEHERVNLIRLLAVIPKFGERFKFSVAAPRTILY
jgi:Clp amino terminal domain, pathogenicity island component